MDLIEACAKARELSEKTEKTVRVVYGHGGKYEIIYHDETNCYEIWASYKNGRCIGYTPWGHQ